MFGHVYHPHFAATAAASSSGALVGKAAGATGLVAVDALAGVGAAGVVLSTPA